MPFPTRDGMPALHETVGLQMPQWKLAGKSRMVMQDDANRMRTAPFGQPLRDRKSVARFYPTCARIQCRVKG